MTTEPEIEGAKYDPARGAASLDAFVRLDEPEQLMWELAKLAEDLSARNPRSDGWRFIAKWAKEANEEFAKTQEPPAG